jgi:hypothetical protein
MANVPPFPPHNPEVWQATIGNLLIPALTCKAHVTRIQVGAKWDVKEGPGANGATATFHGKKLARFTLTLEAGWRNASVTTEDGHALLWQLTEQIGQATAAGAPIEISHPVLDLYDVSRMLVEGIDGPLYEDQLVRVTLECIQYAPRAKKNVTKTPAGSTSETFGSVQDVFLAKDAAATAPTPPSATAPKP